MRASMPTLHCDAEGCDEWSPDYFEQTASTVDGIRITVTRRAPGWSTHPGLDLCPAHTAPPMDVDAAVARTVAMIEPIRERLRAAVPCPTPGCYGDGRYAPPGRGHRDGCALT